jgi:MFS family permease
VVNDQIEVHRARSLCSTAVSDVLEPSKRELDPRLLAFWAITAAFTTYFCMYAFRKPFAAAGFDGEVWGVQLKIALVLSQVIGYALSKFIGIRLVSETPSHRRAWTLVGLIVVAELALVVFGLVGPRGKVIAMFFNGLPLGAVWGLVFGFLEGRKTTELLGAGLSASYIVASGIVKAVGLKLMDFGVPETWMPAACGAAFLPIFLISVLALARLPAPTRADIDARTKREVMNSAERRSFFARFAPGLLALTALYVFLTAYRDFRDNFAAEVFEQLGVLDAAIFARSETVVAVCVLALLGAIFMIQDNRRALLAIHALMGLGVVLIAAATAGFGLGLIDGVTWMILIGVGLYLGYVPYGCVLFDRLIAATGVVGTSVFMIYVTDAFGYVGSIGVLLFKNFGQRELSWLDFLVGFSWVTAGVGAVGFLISGFYFARVTRGHVAATG